MLVSPGFTQEPKKWTLLGTCRLTAHTHSHYLLISLELEFLLPPFVVFSILWLYVYQLSSWSWGGVFHIPNSLELLAYCTGLKTKPYWAKVIDWNTSFTRPITSSLAEVQSNCCVLDLLCTSGGNRQLLSANPAAKRCSWSQSWQALI